MKAIKIQNSSASESLGKTIAEFEKRQIIYSILGLLILIGASIIANSLHLQAVAEQSTRYVTRMIQLEQMREVTFVLEEAIKSNFETVTYKSKNPRRNFTMPATYVVFDLKRSWHSLVRDKIVIPVDNPLSASDDEAIIYEYNRFLLVPYAFLLWLFMILVSIPQTRLVKRRLVEQFEKDLVIEKGKTLEAISEEVRHNLRTPLASLMRLPARMPGNMEHDKELLKTSIEQIRKITAALDRKKINQTTDHVVSTSIYDTLYKALNQVSTAIPNHINFTTHVDDSLCSAKVPHIPVELQIVIGNIVNNSMDALQNGTGSMSIRAQDVAPDLILEITDTGPGISENVIKHIFEKGFTSGKENGTGLGLYHAHSWVTQWGGTIRARSEPHRKTTITIRLPISDRASWYVPRLKFKSTDEIYILDDQITARQLWKIKLNEYKVSARVHLLSSATEAKTIITDPKLDSANSIFIFDYDLKENHTGLDLLNLLPKNTQRYLATGHFDKPEVREACDKYGIYLIPKSEIADLPIVVF